MGIMRARQWAMMMVMQMKITSIRYLSSSNNNANFPSILFISSLQDDRSTASASSSTTPKRLSVQFADANEDGNKSSILNLPFLLFWLVSYFIIISFFLTYQI